jgi:hypothetical protein
MPRRFDIRYDTSDLDRPTHPFPPTIDDDPLVRTVNRLNPPRDYLSDPEPSPEEYDRLVNNARDYLSDPDPLLRNMTVL